MQKPILLLCSNSFFSSRSAHRTWRIQEGQIFKGPGTSTHPPTKCTRSLVQMQPPVHMRTRVLLIYDLGVNIKYPNWSLLHLHMILARYYVLLYMCRYSLRCITQPHKKLILWLLTLFFPMRISSSRSSYGSSSSLRGNGGDSSLLLFPFSGRMPSSLSAMKLKPELH